MHAEPIELGFSVADAERPTASYDGEELELRFHDWAARPHVVTFVATIAFRWQDADAVGAGEAFDGSNLIVDSPWLAEHAAQELTTPKHRHLKLNFNTGGCLEVICANVRCLVQEQAED